MQILAEPCRSRMAVNLGHGVLESPNPPPPALRLFQCTLNPTPLQAPSL